MNIFIVEDEHWALLEMVSLLSEYEPDYTIHPFDNGEDAFAKIEEYRPELIITDITMPGMTGMELVEKVKLKDPSIECIILTVHDTFDYAKKGIQLGVMDYLLKPIKKRELYDVMDKSIEKIKQKKQDQVEKQQWSINNLLFTSTDKSMKEADFFESQKFYLVYLLIGNWQAPTSWEQLDSGNLDVEQKIGNVGQYWKTILDSQRKLLLIPSNLESVEDKIRELFTYYHTKSQTHLCFHKKGPNTSLSEAFQNVHNHLEQQKLFGKSTFLHSELENVDQDLSSLWTMVRIIEKQIRNGEFSILVNQIDHLIKNIKERNLSQRQLFRFLYDMYYALLYNLQQTANNPIQTNVIDDYFASLDKMVTFSELKQWLIKLLETITEIYQPKVVAPKHLIPKVKSWIEQHYSESITFQQFADENHVSLSYLSREFKTQTDMTFSEYLTSYRMKQAKIFFANGVRSTKEVGALVGYHDPKHFRLVFKKTVGLTPKEYMKELEAKK